MNFKPGILSNVEKCFIENNKTVPLEEISKELNRAEAIISKHLESLPKPKKEKTKMRKLIGSKREATVMTPAASQLSDAAKVKSNKLEHLKDSIFKPMG